jgi:hypothetical protein
VNGFYIPILDEVKQFCSAFFKKKDSDIVGVYSKIASLQLNIRFSDMGVICRDGKFRTYQDLLWGFKEYAEKVCPTLLSFESCWFNEKRAFLQYTSSDVLSLNDSDSSSRKELERNKYNKQRKMSTSAKKNKKNNKGLSPYSMKNNGKTIVVQPLPQRIKRPAPNVPKRVRVGQAIGEKVGVALANSSSGVKLGVSTKVGKNLGRKFRLSPAGRAYLKALINPIAIMDAGIEVKYPDKYASKTYAWTSKLVLKSIPFIEGYADVAGPSVIGDLGDGTINYFVQPFFRQPLRILEIGKTSVTKLYAIVSSQDTYYGLKSLDSGAPSLSDKLGEMVISTVPQQIVANYVFSMPLDNVLGENVENYPYRFEDEDDAKQHFGYPIRTRSMSVSFTCNTPVTPPEVEGRKGKDKGPLVSETVKVEVYDAINGLALSTTQALVNGYNTVELTSLATQGAGKLPGVRIEISTNASAFQVSDIVINVNEMDDEKLMTYTGHSLPGYQGLYTSADRYRVVAMSALLTNVSNQFSINGTTTGILVRGGEPPLYNNIADSGQLGEFDGAYNGKLKDGQYTWWHPFDTRDMEFQNKSGDSWLRPYIINTSKFSIGDSTTNQFQLVVGICYEMTTHSQTYRSTSSPVDLKALVAADKLVSKLQCCVSTSNDAHDDILKFLKIPVELTSFGVDELIGKFDKLPPAFQNAIPLMQLMF